MIFRPKIDMGNANSVTDREEIGDKVFNYVKDFLDGHQVREDGDSAELEEITGIILDSCNDIEELKSLVTDNTAELERRIIKSKKFLEKQSKQKQSFSPVIEKEQSKMEQKRQELIDHFERLDPSLDSAQIADELLRLPEKELDYVVSAPKNLNEFLKSCSSKSRNLVIPKIDVCASSCKLDIVKLPEKLKKDPKETLNSSELSNHDVDALIGNQLFQKVSQLHPSKAEVITGVLLELQKDVVLHLLVSLPLLHKNIAVVLSELKKQDKLSARDLITLQEEIGDVIYSLLEGDLDSDQASHVTGMLLETNIAEVHEVLADEKLFNNRVKAALTTLQRNN